jgi:hypothetical protein
LRELGQNRFPSKLGSIVIENPKERKQRTASRVQASCEKMPLCAWQRSNAERRRSALVSSVFSVRKPLGMERPVEMHPMSSLKAKATREPGAELIGCHKQAGKESEGESSRWRIVPKQHAGDGRRREHRRQDYCRHRIADMPRVPTKHADFERTHDQLVKMQTIRLIGGTTSNTATEYGEQCVGNRPEEYQQQRPRGQLRNEVQ